MRSYLKCFRSSLLGDKEKDMKMIHDKTRSAFRLNVKNSLIMFIIIVFLSGCSTAEEEKPVSRLDDGHLYYMEYEKDYYGLEVMQKMRELGIIDPGCSTFFTYNTEGEPLACRNYDYPHRVSKEDKSFTGLNVVLHCKPEGKYESISVADAIWCDPGNPQLIANGPDQKDFDFSLLDVLPYQCGDGINEKGLFVCMMKLDIKEGDQPGRMPAGSSILLRYMLDDCANVEEAIRKVETSLVTPEDWQGCHFFVSDAQGNYAVIESRNSEVSIVDSNVVTNFYLAYDDAEDYYKKDELREEAVLITDENGEIIYSFGYGHGYHRFITIAAQLERFRDLNSEDLRTTMPEEQALVILQSAVQNSFTEAVGTSFTQYSAIYNSARKTVRVWSFQDYGKSYSFDVTGKRID